MLDHKDTRPPRAHHPWRRHLDPDLAAALLMARLRAHLSQGAVADSAEISRSYLSRLEAGTRVPRAGTVVRLARVTSMATGWRALGCPSNPGGT